MEDKKDIEVEMSSFQFNKSAEFYKLNTELQENIVEHIKESIVDKCYEMSKIEEGEVNGLTYRFFAFKKNESTPSFCSKNLPFLQEQKTGYFLLVNEVNYAAIFKQNILLPKDVRDCFENINYDDFIKFNIEKNTEYKYLNMRNTDGADYAIRTKTFEGNDLKKNISSVSSNKYAIQTMRGKTGDKSFSLNFGTSRLNNYCPKNTLDEVCNWVKEIFSYIKNNDLEADESFLGNFAMKSKFTNFKDYEPAYLLINLSELNTLLEMDDVEIYQDDKEYNRELFGNYEKIIEIKKEDDEYVASVQDIKIIVSEKNSKIILDSEEWNKITIRKTPDSKYDGTFEYFINNNNFFSIYFKNRQNVYMNGALYCDNKLLERVDMLLDYMYDDELPELKDCEYEKYEEFKKDENGKFVIEDGKRVKVSTEEIDKWDDNSEFFIVEKKFKDKFECFICDDCQNEWADYIGINSDCIEFFACKYKSLKRKSTSNKDSKNNSTSASNFQDVVGQALKNLGNFIPFEEQIEKKEVEWADTYLKSPIQRTRKGNLKKGLSFWKDGMTNPNYKKTFSLVVNFLKKETFKKGIKELRKYKNKDANKPAHVEEMYQQLWILSNFVNSCLEQGVTPRIYCT